MTRYVVQQGGPILGHPIYVAADEEDAKRYLGTIADYWVDKGKQVEWVNSLSLRIRGRRFGREYGVMGIQSWERIESSEGEPGLEPVKFLGEPGYDDLIDTSNY